MTFRGSAKQPSLLACAVFALSGCGGGGGGDLGGIDGSGAPATVAKASSGPINGFGSVIVNGVRFETDEATILISGEAALESDLTVGNYVTVVGSIASDGLTGVANEVRFQPTVIGPITSISTSSDRFVVLGQTVQVTDATSYSDDVTPRSLNGLAVSDIVEVSGSRDSSDNIIATSVEILAAEDLELFGRVADLDEDNSNFTLNGFTIDYSNATEVEPSLEALQNGALAVAEGSSLNGDALIADAVYIESTVFGSLDDIGDFSVEGLVTEFTNSNSFVVSGVEISVTAETDLVDGTLDDLALDVFVEVGGELNQEDVLVAEFVEFLSFPDRVIVGQVEDIDVTAGAVSTGSIVVGGQEIVATVDTQYEDYSEADIPQFDLSDINIGDLLTVSGYEDDEQFVAELIEREDDGFAFEIEIQGIVSEVLGETLMLFGFTVSVNEETEFYFEEQEINSEEFFDMVQGQLVEVEGLAEGTEIVAERLSIFVDD